MANETYKAKLYFCNVSRLVSLKKHELTSKKRQTFGNMANNV